MDPGTPTTNGHCANDGLKGEIRLLPTDQVIPNPAQPREYFDEEALEALADGIEQYGQLYAILVIPLDEPIDGARYRIFDGERRWRAVTRRNHTHIRAFIADNIEDAEHAYRLSVGANFNREEHTPIEIANSIAELKRQGLRDKDIANLTGKSEKWIHYYYRLQKLHQDVVEMMDPRMPDDKRLKKEVAQLLTQCSHRVQRKVAPQVVGKKMSRSRARTIIDGVNQTEGGKTPQRDQPARHYERANRLAENTLEQLANLDEKRLHTAIASRDPGEVERLKERCELIARHSLRIAEAAGEVLEKQQHTSGNGTS